MEAASDLVSVLCLAKDLIDQLFINFDKNIGG